MRECVDVAVVGAGTAGAAVAAMCARAGLGVSCFDARSLDQTGARWVNGVPSWAYDHVGLSRPIAPELRSGHGNFHLIAGWGPERLVVRPVDVLDVDMGALTGRLHSIARAHGAELWGRCRVHGWEDEALRTDRGLVKARWVVDASGLRTAGLVPVEPLPRSELCVAAQEVRAVIDPDAALAWVTAQGGRPGDTLCFSGVAGGYSILNAKLCDGEISLLTGSMASSRWPSGPALLRRFVEEHRWIGPLVFGGAGSIPVGGPRSQLARGRVLLFGDAGWQVYAAHGSGVAVQLVAAQELAQALAAGHGLVDYEESWRRRWCGDLAVSASFARFSRSLDPGALACMLRAGLVCEELVVPALEQRRPRLGVRTGVRLARRALGTGRIGLRLGVAVVQTELARRQWLR